jgi:hypothetical protein
MDFIKVDLGSMAKSISDPIKAAIEKEGKIADIKANVEANLQKFIIDQEELVQKNEAEITKRTQADMLSDSWLSKNIRPIILIYLTACFTISFVLSYFGYLTTNELLVNLLSNLMLTVYGFYFGGRSAEKISSMLIGVLSSIKEVNHGK